MKLFCEKCSKVTNHKIKERGAHCLKCGNIDSDIELNYPIKKIKVRNLDFYYGPKKDKFSTEEVEDSGYNW